jgi:hypothetical protein
MDRRMAKSSRTAGYAASIRYQYAPSANGHGEPARRQPELETPREGTS